MKGNVLVYDEDAVNLNLLMIFILLTALSLLAYFGWIYFESEGGVESVFVGATASLWRSWANPLHTQSNVDLYRRIRSWF